MRNPFPLSQHLAKDAQQKRIRERKSAVTTHANVCGIDFVIHRGVYHTSVDTELMAQTVRLEPDDTFLEIGCGSGAISILLGQKCKHGVATDINPLAIDNAKENATRLHVANVSFILGDCFAGIQEKFNVLVCNPPYNNYPTEDMIERMFWDPNDELKKNFFKNAASRLLPGGRIYFGWANFQDININLPLTLTEKNNFSLTSVAECTSRSGKYRNFVLEFKKKRNKKTSDIARKRQSW